MSSRTNTARIVGVLLAAGLAGACATPGPGTAAQHPHTQPAPPSTSTAESDSITGVLAALGSSDEQRIARARAELVTRADEALPLLERRARELGLAFGPTTHRELVEVLRTLGAIGPRVAEDVDFLFELDQIVRSEAPYQEWLRADQQAAADAWRAARAEAGRILGNTGVAGFRALVSQALKNEPGWGRPAQARSRLCYWEPSGPGIAQSLLALQTDPDERVRLYAAVSLANVVPPVVDALLDELGSTDPARRLRALRAARGFVEHHARVAPRLVPFLASEDGAERYWACFALAGLTPSSIDTLLRALHHEDGAVRALAAEGIEKSIWPFLIERSSPEFGGYATWHGLPPEMQLKAESLELLVTEGLGDLTLALGDEREDVRVFVAMTCWKLGPRALSARAAVEHALEDRSAGVRFWAAHALRRIDATPRERLLAWARRLREGQPAVAPWRGDVFAARVAELDEPGAWGRRERNHAAWSDARDVRFEAARDIVQHELDGLLARERGADARQAEEAQRVLAKLERALEERVDVLVRILDDEFSPGDKAGRELAALGPCAWDALAHDLLRFPRFPMGTITYEGLVWVLEQLGDDALPILAVGLEHWRDEGQVWSAQALFKLGPRASPALTAVLSAWRSVGADARIPGLQNHWDCPVANYFADDDVSGATADGTRWVCGPCHAGAVAALGGDALPALLGGLGSLHALERARCARAVAALKPDPAIAGPALARGLDDVEPWVRRAMAEALAAVTPAGSELEQRARRVLDAAPR